MPEDLYLLPEQHSWREMNMLSTRIPPGQNTGLGSHSLLQGIFPTQGSHPGPCNAGGFFTN